MSNTSTLESCSCPYDCDTTRYSYSVSSTALDVDSLCKSSLMLFTGIGSSAIPRTPPVCILYEYVTTVIIIRKCLISFVCAAIHAQLRAVRKRRRQPKYRNLQEELKEHGLCQLSGRYSRYYLGTCTSMVHNFLQFQCNLFFHDVAGRTDGHPDQAGAEGDVHRPRVQLWRHPRSHHRRQPRQPGGGPLLGHQVMWGDPFVS